jgi:hypothetical protein
VSLLAISAGLMVHAQHGRPPAGTTRGIIVRFFHFGSALGRDQRVLRAGPCLQVNGQFESFLQQGAQHSVHLGGVGRRSGLCDDVEALVFCPVLAPQDLILMNSISCLDEDVDASALL